MVVLTRAARKREKEVIEARFRFVLDDIEECRPNKIVLRCIVPLPKLLPPYHPGFHGDIDHLCYEGAYRFSKGFLFWPLTRLPDGYAAHVFHLPEFDYEHDLLRCLYQDKFYLR